jgi:hypothetical protein
VWPMDDREPYRLLPYRSLARIWGCTTEAAQERVRRNKWPKQPGNGREVLIRVPLAVLEDVAHDPEPSPTDLRQSIKAQREAEVQALRDRADAAEAAAKVAQQEALEAKALAKEAGNQVAELRVDLAKASGEVAGLNRALVIAEEAARRADDGRRDAVAGAAALQAALAAVQAEASAQKERAGLALGELEGMKLATKHQHDELAQMRREVAEAHNRAVAAEQEALEATKLREGAEVALAKARSWNFLNFLFGREGKGRG